MLSKDKKLFRGLGDGFGLLPDHVVRGIVLQVEGDDVFGIGGNDDVFAHARHRARERLCIEALLINGRGGEIRWQLIGERRRARW